MPAFGRLLPVETANGASQMRRDEDLLRECAESVAEQNRHPERSEERAQSTDDGTDLGFAFASAPPVLRFYHWDPPCISLGRNQDLANHRHGFIDQASAVALGVDIVRRPSGGRAILHYNDLTYALIMPAPSDDVSSSHRVIAAGLASGLRLLGLSVDDGFTLMPPDRNPADCFAAVAGADLQASGRKVMGSAQRRTGGALLEHGTLYLKSPEPLYSQVFGQPFGGSVMALDEALGRVATFEEVAQALTRGLEAALGVAFA